MEFPIIEVPWEVRFSDITTSILSLLHNWQRHIFNQSEELQKQLLHLFLSGSDLSQAAEVIEREIEAGSVEEAFTYARDAAGGGLEMHWQPAIPTRSMRVHYGS